MNGRIFAGLLLCSLLMWNAMGQPPGFGPVKGNPKDPTAKGNRGGPTPPADPVVQKPPASPASQPVQNPVSLEQLIEGAALNDPEVKIAEAELQLAKAKLDAIRVNAVKKLMAMRAMVDDAESQVRAMEANLVATNEVLTEARGDRLRFEKQGEQGIVSQTEVRNARQAAVQAELKMQMAKAQLEQAKANLTRVQGEWKNLTMSKKTVYLPLPNTDEARLKEVARAEEALFLETAKRIRIAELQKPQPMPSSTTLEKLRAGLKTVVKLQESTESLQQILSRILQSAKIDVVFIHDKTFKDYRIDLPAGELTVSEWLMLIVDQFKLYGGESGNYEFYVREYGLLLSPIEKEPNAGTVTLKDFLNSQRTTTASGSTTPAANASKTSEQRMIEDLNAQLARLKVSHSGAPLVEVPKGSPIERLKQGLSKPVKAAPKQLSVEATTNELIANAGLNIVVRYPAALDPTINKDTKKLTLPAAEMPLVFWLQLITDELGGKTTSSRGMPSPFGGQSEPRYEFYIRNYGLLLAATDTAPPGAVTVAAFWKQIQLDEKASEKK